MSEPGRSSHPNSRIGRGAHELRISGKSGGMMKIKTKRAVFAGTARNCSGFLVEVLENVSRLAALYEDAAFVIVENDSDDQTKSMLRSWLCRQSQGHLIELDGLAAAEPRRTQRLAIARNAYLDHILSGTYCDYHHLVVLDFDDVNALPISIENFVASVNFLEAKPAAAAVFANQPMAYYDVYALRHWTWCPGDCWKQVAARPRWMPLGIAKALYVHRRQFSIPADARPFRVRSAFGGLGIYKISKIQHCRYDGLDIDGGEVCENVTFNQQICDRGGELFIYPKLLNQSPSEHLVPNRSALVMGAIRLWQAIFPPWKRLDSWEKRLRQPFITRRTSTLS